MGATHVTWGAESVVQLHESLAAVIRNWHKGQAMQPSLSPQTEAAGDFWHQYSSLSRYVHGIDHQPKVALLPCALMYLYSLAITQNGRGWKQYKIIHRKHQKQNNDSIIATSIYFICDIKIEFHHL